MPSARAPRRPAGPLRGGTRETTSSLLRRRHRERAPERGDPGGAATWRAGRGGDPIAFDLRGWSRARAGAGTPAAMLVAARPASEFEAVELPAAASRRSDLQGRQRTAATDRGFMIIGVVCRQYLLAIAKQASCPGENPEPPGLRFVTERRGAGCGHPSADRVDLRQPDRPRMTSK